ncbi:unnamed protein product [Lactuca virosa]|uniref:Endonuclease/exonuclease/phosphatase domain-containing protein n=1 Tax=Lactuca virosa TaxID=75947 RepID=A0AAU9P7C8_9ASTR|nr:unnamed protein product [Lactuca virosa]
MENKNAIWLLMGDFNEVREKCDRLSKIVCASSMEAFNSFIHEADLEDFAMWGRKFTWMSQDGKSLSKIDRFLVCHGFLAHWNMASVTALPRLHSDHSPLILVSDFYDFGPIPFKIFNSWPQLDGLHKIVLDSWAKPIKGGDNDKLLLRKFQPLKNDIRCWRYSLRNKENEEYGELVKKIDLLELQAEQRGLSSPERASWKKWKSRIIEIDSIRRLDLNQKARESKRRCGVVEMIKRRDRTVSPSNL